MMAWLADGLVDRGHEVTIIGVGAPGTRASFIPTFEEAQFPRLGECLPESLHVATAARILDDLAVDVVHDHTCAGPLGATRRHAPTVLTAHGPATGELGSYYELLADETSVVAISQAQRAEAPHLPWAGMVHNAIPVDDYPFQAEKEDFCLFLGRISPEKAPDLAIKAARAAGRPIVVAAKCNERAEQSYFEERVRPLLGRDAVWFGEANQEQKKDLLARARCLIFPIQWNEPFGIVMVEAMACGTPWSRCATAPSPRSSTTVSPATSATASWNCPGRSPAPTTWSRSCAASTSPTTSTCLPWPPPTKPSTRTSSPPSLPSPQADRSGHRV